MGFFDGFSVRARMIILVVTLLLTTLFVCAGAITYWYTGMKANIEFGSFKITQPEDPSVKKCDLLIKGKTEIAKSFELRISNTIDLLRSEIATTEKATDALNSYSGGRSGVSFDVYSDGPRDFWDDLKENLANRNAREKDTRDSLRKAEELARSITDNLGQGCVENP